MKTIQYEQCFQDLHEHLTEFAIISEEETKKKLKERDKLNILVIGDCLFLRVKLREQLTRDNDTIVEVSKTRMSVPPSCKGDYVQGDEHNLLQFYFKNSKYCNPFDLVVVDRENSTANTLQLVSLLLSESGVLVIEELVKETFPASTLFFSNGERDMRVWRNPIHLIAKRVLEKEEEANLLPLFDSVETKLPEVALCSVCLLEEHIDILEFWIEHHKKKGFGKIALYYNDLSSPSEYKSDSVFRNGEFKKLKINKRGDSYNKELDFSDILKEAKRICSKFEDVELVEWTPNEQGYRQAEAYKDFTEKNKDKIPWFVYLDLDEFITGNYDIKRIAKWCDSRDICHLTLLEVLFKKNSADNRSTFEFIASLGHSLPSTRETKGLYRAKNLKGYGVHPYQFKFVNGSSIYTANPYSICFSHFRWHIIELDWEKNGIIPFSYKTNELSRFKVLPPIYNNFKNGTCSL